MNQTDQRAYWQWQYRKKEAKRKGIPFTEPKPVKVPSDPKAARKPCGTKALLWKQRSLEIRREQLSRCTVEYDGLADDSAANERQLRDVQDLLRQAA